jgi:hypothetical protein
MGLRAGRVLVIALALAGAGAAAGFAIHKATGGSTAPLRDCAGPLAKAQRDLRKLDAKLKVLRATDAVLLKKFRALSSKLKAIQHKYPSNVLPPKVYAKYRKTQRASDAAYKRYSTSVDGTNDLIARRNAVARRYNRAAKCRTSKTK